MSEILKKIAMELDRVEKMYTSHAASVVNMAENLDKLTTQKSVAARELDVLHGVRQGITHIMNLLSGDPVPLIKDGIEIASDIAENIIEKRVESTNVEAPVVKNEDSK